MMTNQEVTQQQFENLIEDAEYLQDEAEALKYVIDQVPYKEVPPDGMSIYQKLSLIEHMQTEYYRPIVEKTFEHPRVLNLSAIDHFSETFETDDEEEIDIIKLLNKIIKHRAALLNLFKKIPLIDWERGINDKRDNLISVYDFASDMVREERKILKEIADLVLIYQNNKQQQRSVQRGTEQRSRQGDEDSRVE